MGDEHTIRVQEDTEEAPAEATEDGGGEQGQGESNEQTVDEKDHDEEQAGEDEENYSAEVANGSFSNMNFSGSGDMNQMQMMMAMQNGMAPFGNFPMMGM